MVVLVTPVCFLFLNFLPPLPASHPSLKCVCWGLIPLFRPLHTTFQPPLPQDWVVPDRAEPSPRVFSWLHACCKGRKQLAGLWLVRGRGWRQARGLPAA